MGLAVGDSDEDFSCRYHQWREFHSASVIKVITLGALLYQLQQEHESLSPDQAALATAMITESDNDAQDTLWNEIGMPALQAFVNAARMNHTVLGTDDFWGLTEVNAHDELCLLQLLITHNKVLNAASRRYALTLMADVIPGQRWGVPAGAPADMTVHVKNGWLPDPDLWDINSIGDFTRRDLDYSIAILTSDDPDMAYGVDTVEAIARLINQALAESDADGAEGAHAGAVPAPAVHAAAILPVNRATYHRGMPRRLAAGSASDLVQAERDIRDRIGDQHLDFAAMAAVSNIYRAANVIRNHMERKVLADEDLSWAAFTVLFVLWIWGDQQTRHLAAEAGVTKGTLTGVLKTLEKRGLARRRAHESDGRLVLVSLEPKGLGVIERLFPAFNMGEAFVSASLTEREKNQLASLLRTIIRSVEDS